MGCVSDAWRLAAAEVAGTVGKLQQYPWAKYNKRRHMDKKEQ